VAQEVHQAHVDDEGYGADDTELDGLSVEDSDSAADAVEQAGD
jgi:hypothetical protein